MEIMSVVHSDPVRPSLPQEQPAGPHRFTVDVYFELARLNLISGRTELVNGEIIHMSPIRDDHSLALQDLYDLLRTIFPKPWFIKTQATHTMGRYDAREPDIALLRNRPKPIRGAVGASPAEAQAELIVEVARTSLGMDLGEKRLQYASRGVPEYWVVDLKREVVHVFREPVPHATTSEQAYAYTSMVDVNGTLSALAAPQAVIAVNDFMPVGWND